MKKYGLCLLALALCLSGCAAAETFETIADEWDIAIQAPLVREILLEIPDNAALLTAQQEEGSSLYFCEDYSFSVQVLSGGDLDKTLRSVTGFGLEDITVMETRQGNTTRYDMVWTSAGEDGDQVNRAAILDDGAYHYVLSAQTGEAQTQAVAAEWERLFQSFWVT